LKQKETDSNVFFIECDFIIPPEAARKKDELPLGIQHMTIRDQDLSEYTKEKNIQQGVKFKPSRRLIACHLKKENYLTTLPLLQLYMELGAEVTAVKNIIKFEKRNFFKTFVERNLELRKKTNSTFKSSIFKLLSNSSFGRTILNKRMRSTTHRVVKTQAVYEKYCANPFLKQIIDVSEKDDYSVFISDAEEIVLDQPIHVGFHILENSKLEMYNLFHKVIKPNYGDNVKLLYSDTDSFILGFTGVDDIYQEMSSGALAPYMDMSNYDPSSIFFDNSRKGAFSCLKDEMGGQVVTEAICLLPKSYSLLTEDRVGGEKQTIACKGVPYREQKKIKHETYRNLLAGSVNHVVVKCSNIRSEQFKLYTTHTNKKCVTNIDIKRYYLSNVNSVAYGHPRCVSSNKRALDHNEKESSITCMTKKKRV
jgi:hypothetical protein